jgi:DNA-3-methyladenine glycosylase II
MIFEMKVTGEAIAYLSEKDPILGKYIASVGPLVRSGISDPYIATIDCILSQQISAKAYQTIAGRFYARFKDADPHLILDAPFEDIRAVGLSTPKSNYVRGIAQAKLDKTIDFDALYDLSFEEIKSVLTTLRGVGRWTVEMVSIFSLHRLDVISYDDLAIRNGIKRLYHKKEVTKDFFNELNQHYAPYQSYASFYLWHASQMKEDIQ